MKGEKIKRLYRKSGTALIFQSFTLKLPFWRVSVAAGVAATARIAAVRVAATVVAAEKKESEDN